MGVIAITRLVDQLKALGDMTRLKLLKLLLDREYCVCELAAIIGISQPGISQHLRKLKSAGWVTERKDGQWVYYRANETGWAEFQKAFGDFLSAALENVPEMQEEVSRVKHLEENPIVLACKTRQN